MNVVAPKFIATILGLFFIGVTIFFYYQKPNPQVIPVNQTTHKIEQVTLENTEIVRTETIQCGNDTYIFDTVFIKDKGYFNDIYKNARLSESFVARLKPPQGDSLESFFVITTAKKDCNKIFLSIIKEETDVPMKGIFAWQVDSKEVRKLNTSNKFTSNYIPFRKNEWISPDGAKIIIARPTNAQANNQQCNYKELLLVDLNQDISKTLIILPDGETLDDNSSDLSPYCGGLNFGWSNESIVYYSVYNSEMNHSFIGQRTLVVN